MKKTLLLSISILPALLHHAMAQKISEGHWGQKGYDVAYAAAATDDGGYIITGLTQSGSDTTGDIIVIKTNADNDTLWTLRYGGPKLEGGNSVIQTADGGYLVSGHTEDFGADDCDAFMMKLTKDGTYEWLKVYGGKFDDVCAATLEMPNGYLFTGVTASYGNGGVDGNRHAYFVRTDNNGNVDWAKYYGGAGIDYSYSIATLPGGGFLAAGYTTSYGSGEEDGWLLRLTDDGDTLWTKRFAYGGNTRLYKLLPLADGSYILAGYTSACPTCDLEGMMVKLNSDGKEKWRRSIRYWGDMTMFHDVVQLTNGNLLFAGTRINRAHVPGDKTGAYLLTTNADGVTISDTAYGGNDAIANAIALQGNNGFLIAGETNKYGDAQGDLYYMQLNNTISGISTVSESWPHLYPNPVKDKPAVLVLPAAEASQSVRVELSTYDGKVISIKDNVPAKYITIDPGSLLPGLYLYRVSCKDGKTFKGKFVVE